MFNTIDIAPESIRGDPNVQAICYAIDKEFTEIYGEIPDISFIPNIEVQISPLLDILGWQFHVDVWQGWSGALDDETKRQLILESLRWHSKKGTKWVVEQMLNTVFKQGSVTEWYEYGGRPYFFRIVTLDDIVDPVQLQTVLNAVYAVKNERSWLDSFIRARQQVQTLYIGIAVTQQITTKVGLAIDHRIG
jgi:phage tail P2-like protein